MNPRTSMLFTCIGLLIAGCGRSSTTTPSPKTSAETDVRTVRLHFDGFTKSKSGATWMAWPNKVKKALVGLSAVSDVKMDVEHDEFVVTFDAKTVTVDDLLRLSKETGFEARVVSSAQAVSFETSLDVALAKARRENKPVVVDFIASWCAPCKRMLQETFPDPSVAPLLRRCVVVKIDTDEQPEVAKRFGVVGLPDIRFLSPAGKEQRKLLDFQPAPEFVIALNELLATPFSPTVVDDRLSDLAEDEQPLKEAFQSDQGNVRMILILSPT